MRVPATQSKEISMERFNRLAHSVWDCKYHIVWIPKYRRKEETFENLVRLPILGFPSNFLKTRSKNYHRIGLKLRIYHISGFII